MKRFLSVIILFQGLKLFSQCTPNITDNLIANWRFAGNALDSSQNHVDGTVVNALIDTNRCGVQNDSYNFSAVGASQHISVANNTLLNLNSTDFSISAWIFETDSSLAPSDEFQHMIIAKRNGFLPTSGYSMGVLHNRKLLFAISGGGSASDKLTSKTKLCVQKWNHVVITYDDTTETLAMYINSVLDTSVGSISSPSSTNASFRIGDDLVNSTNQFNGNIDDINIFHRHLEPCDIDSLFRQFCPELILQCGEVTGLIDDFGDINLYPNPSNGQVMLDLTKLNAKDYFVTISNCYGAILNQKKIQNGKYEIGSDFSPGLYFVRVQMGTKIFSRKLIVL